MPTQIAIASFQIPDCNFTGSTCKLRRYYDQEWQDVDGVIHLSGDPGSATDFFDEVPGTITGNTITFPSFNVTPTLTALVGAGVKETWQVWDQSGRAREVIADGWFIPASPTSITIGALQILNQGQSLLWPPRTYLTAPGVQALIDAEVGAINDASDVIKGRTYLDPAPLVAGLPTAIGTNNRRISSCIYRPQAYIGSDIVRIQAAINAAKSDGAGHVDFQAASYLIPTPLLLTEVKGVGFHGAGPDNTKIIATGGQPAVQCNGIWRSRFQGIQFSTSAVISGAAVFEMDGNYDGIGHTQGVQGNTIDSCFFDAHGLADYAFALCRRGSASAQGSENVFINCDWQSPVVYGFFQTGANALNNLFIGGNWQDHITGVFVVGGSITMVRPAFQSTRGYAQITGGGWDIDASTFSAGERITIIDPDSESLRFANFSAQVGIVSGLSNRLAGVGWNALSGYTANQLLAKATAAGNGKLYRVTTAGTSGSGEPVWPESGTVADGGVVWTQLDYTVIKIASGSITDCIIPYGQIETVYGGQGGGVFVQHNQVSRPDYRIGGGGTGQRGIFSMNYMSASGGSTDALIVDSYTTNRVGGALATTTPLDITASVREGNIIPYTPTQNSTLDATTTPAYGQEIQFVVTTSGVSSFNITFGTNFKSQGVLATGTVSGKVFIVKFISDGASYYEVSRSTAM